jgi:hypothetical protein
VPSAHLANQLRDSAQGGGLNMHVMRYVVSRIFVFWLSVAILVYGWFNHTKLVNGGYGASEAFVRSLTRVDETGKTETVVLHILHLDDLVVIGAIMLVVTLLLTAARNLTLGSGERRMTVIRALAHVLVLLVLAYAALAVVWWYDAPLINALFDASRNLIARVAVAIDPQGKLELVLRSLGVARHLVVACLMLALALIWEMTKAMGRGARAKLSASA